VDESSWEYLDSILIHRSPESNQHNVILNLFTQRIKNNLDPHQFIIRTSRVALSIGNDKPEPDLMIFERDTFRKKKRKDQSESEIIDATPLLIIEIVSKSSDDLDHVKVKKYCSIGVKEIWRIFLNKTPIQIIISILKEGDYKEITYTQGEVRSQTLPTFAIRFEELKDPDSSK
jgi:Uma2 family endonuclease